MMETPKTRYAKTDDNETELNAPECVQEDDELSKEDVLDSFERGFRQMLNGETRPALKFLEELENE